MSHDTVIHRIVRPAVRRIAGSGVTPNQVTTARLATGLAAAVGFAQGPGGWMALGAALFLLSMLLDRADGELARQTGLMSVAGYRYDLMADCAASVLAFVGLGIGLADAIDGAPWLGLVAGAGIGVLFAELNLLNFASVRGYTPVAGLTVDPDDAMVLVPLLVWAGLAAPMLVAAAIVTPLAAMGLALAAFIRRQSGRHALR